MADPNLTEFEALSVGRRRRPCYVALAIGEITDQQDVVNVNGALEADPSDITAGAIERWFEAREFAVSANAITSHRKGRCACYG